ncbi:MAG: adenylate/guanylate cyclase domain-containing protein [Treponema sp.]|nr:adenylate/guanylate cyclase domain-containing protein [Treponema sp.]
MKKLRELFFVCISILFWTVLLALGAIQKFELKFSDLLLYAKKAPAEAPEILIVAADNLALESIGPWPWKRDVYADMLFRMKELGAKTAVFDIEFLSPSNFPECDEEFAHAIQFFGNTYLITNSSDLDITYPQEELEYISDRFMITPEGSVKDIIDGNHRTIYESQKNTLFGFNKIDWSDPKVIHDFGIGLSPAMKMFITHAKGSGFANVILDRDGVRRRVILLEYNKDFQKCLPQIMLGPIIEQTGPEKVILKKNKIILKNASTGGKNTDIKIPLDGSGRLIVNWTHKEFKDAFRQESISILDQFNKVEKNIDKIIENQVTVLSDISNLINDDEFSSLSKAAKDLQLNYGDIKDFKEFLLSICEGYDNESNPINDGIPEEYYDQFFDLRRNFFKDVKSFSDSYDSDSIQGKLFNYRDSLGEDNYSYFAQTFDQLFTVLADEINLYLDMFDEKSKIYNGALCIIGATASSSTDLGTTPFERAYPNVGTHANVYNTILNQDFIRQASATLWLVIISVLLLLQAFITKKHKPLIQNISGGAIIAFAVLVPFIAIHFFGIYIPGLTAILITVTSFLALTIFRFALAEKDKKFLQTTFGAYVAPAVVAEIVKHPELANLGGKSEYLTALFSDVKTFSGFTEVINNEAGEDKGAERLVEILNEYLGVLSDAIMDNNGTIDKYVGDEIVSFFGAPIPIENNAFSACVAAIRMLQAEEKFNRENKDRLPINPKTGEPFYLHSRVGLNTGNMVVGNMGTQKKLNYTIMGNNVNLASRLEGTNKVYGSWIMCSESTWEMANSGSNEGKLVARKFDNVRVINVKKPVGIYNILGLREEMSQDQIKAAEVFNEGIEIYLKGSDTPEIPKKKTELKKAYELFKKAAEIYPQDISSKVFMKRCSDFIKNGVPEIWDGVYTMTSK